MWRWAAVAAIGLCVIVALWASSECAQREALPATHVAVLGGSQFPPVVKVRNFTVDIDGSVVSGNCGFHNFGQCWVRRNLNGNCSGRQNTNPLISRGVVWKFPDKRVFCDMNLCPLSDVFPGCQSKILGVDHCRHSFWVSGVFPKHYPLHKNVSPKLSIGSVLGDGVGFLGKDQRCQNKKCSDKTENGPKPCRYYLPFSGCSTTLTSISSPYLGVQIFCIVLAAFFFSSITAYGLIRRFDDGDRKAGWIWLASFGAVLGLFFWGWAWAGNPLSAWGLAP